MGSRQERPDTPTTLQTALQIIKVNGKKDWMNRWTLGKTDWMKSVSLYGYSKTEGCHQPFYAKRPGHQY